MATKKKKESSVKKESKKTPKVHKEDEPQVPVVEEVKRDPCSYCHQEVELVNNRTYCGKCRRRFRLI